VASAVVVLALVKTFVTPSLALFHQSVNP
jgi:hypothetical protein